MQQAISLAHLHAPYKINIKLHQNDNLLYLYGYSNSSLHYYILYTVSIHAEEQH
jgi:hypothetical protein